MSLLFPEALEYCIKLISPALTTVSSSDHGMFASFLKRQVSFERYSMPYEVAMSQTWAISFSLNSCAHFSAGML